jgi:hypothetical protein
MKLTQLPLGARFEYEGKIFTKTGPMTAASERRPAHDPATPCSSPPTASPARPRTGQPPPLDEARVLAAFDAFFGTALRLTDDFINRTRNCPTEVSRSTAQGSG